MYQAYNHPNYYWAHVPARYPDNHKEYIDLRDYGPEPFVVNIEDAAEQNRTFRTALWTGNHLQLTLMVSMSGGYRP